MPKSVSGALLEVAPSVCDDADRGATECHENPWQNSAIDGLELRFGNIFHVRVCYSPAELPGKDFRPDAGPAG